MYSNYVNCVVSFGQVPVGTSATRSFPIENLSHETVSYCVTKNTETNPIYYVFDVNKYEAKLEPGGVFHLKITYSPNIPGNKNYDNVRVVDSRKNYCRISFEGECIGPLISCSVRYLNFFLMPLNNAKKQTFQLTNFSQVPAIFQFDSSEEREEVFQVDTLRGTIPPQRHVYITVNFAPQAQRFYSKQLCCLILYHEPIIVNLFGICSPTKLNLHEKVFRYYPVPYEETVGSQGYMSDSVTIKLVPPPTSLTVNHLDFGRIMPDASCQTLTTSFTNHLEKEVEIEWENVSFFRIYPEKLVVPPRQSALYECRFTPNEMGRLFSATIAGHVNWTILEEEDCECLNVPIPINLRMIGHSFPNNESWIPSISIIPNNVVLPVTLPNYPTWANFIVKSEGHLPALFKLLPPGKTNFIMKPMVGFVRNYQIVQVQLEANNSKPTSYVEKWNIEFNGRFDRLLPIFIKAQTELPFVAVGFDNIIQFETLQPGTQSCLYIPIKNQSCCYLQFEFILPDKLIIEPRTGELVPYEEIFATCCYYSDLSDESEIELQVICRMRCMVNGNVTGPPYEVIIWAKAYCFYSELCAIPQSFDCGEVEYGTTIKTSFYLYNFGESGINFMLCHDHDSDVILFPHCARCGSKEKIMISVTFTVKKIGRDCIMIGYNNRISANSEQLVDGATKMVFSIEYNSIHPVIQIVDLVDHNFGYLFDKTSLWEHFRIDEINAALTEVVQGEIKVVECHIPDCEISTDLFYAVFIIKNISKIDTRINLKRRQVCKCVRKESMEAISFRLKFYDCPHKDMLIIETSDPDILANSIRELTVKIKYLLEETSILSYFIELSNNRTVILDFCFTVIPPEALVLSMYTPDYVLNLGYIYIGLREAPIQAFWLYNNTSCPIPYRLDELTITKLCNNEGFPVLKCLNAFGFLKPRTRAPILFRFWPIEVKTYSVTVSLMLGMKMVDFVIKGKGTVELDKVNFNALMSIDTKPVQNKMISLSDDRIILEPLLVGGFAERLFFISNCHKTNVIKYHWRPYAIDGIVKIEPLNSEGTLQAKESHSVAMKITSLNEPCSITILLCCEFYDETDFENTLTSQRDVPASVLLNDTFSLADIALPENVKIERKPDCLFISIPVTVNVVGILDKDLCLSVEDQMKQKPYQGIQINVKNFVDYYCEKIRIKEKPIHPIIVDEEKISQEEKEPVAINKEITQHVLECVVGDAVFSNYFEETLKILKREPSPFYSQIKFGQSNAEESRKEEITKFLTRPETPQVLKICQDMVNESVHTTFRLGPVFKDQ